MKTNRYYQKGNPEIETAESCDVKNDVSENNDVGKYVLKSKNGYSKPEATKFLSAYFVVFSGGTEREKQYFHLINRNPSLFPFVKIAFMPEPNFKKGGAPSIVQYSKDKAREFKESASKESPDSYFLLSDVDHFEQYLPEMKQECYANDIELIISNSCFEVWLYYAEKEDKCLSFEIPQNRLKISSTFKTWANSQVKGGLKPTKAILNIEKNIINAKNNYTEVSGFPTLFSTQMYRLAEKILPFIKDGLNQIQKEINKRKKRNIIFDNE